MTLYEILQVGEEAEPDEIRSAYRRLALRFHPDVQGGDSARFRQIQAAYDVLSDAQARARYDRSLGERVPVQVIRVDRYPETYVEPLIPEFPYATRARPARPLVRYRVSRHDDELDDLFRLIDRFFGRLF